MNSSLRSLIKICGARLRTEEGSTDAEHFIAIHKLAFLHACKLIDAFPNNARAALVHGSAFEFLIGAAIAQAHQHIQFVHGDPQLDLFIHSIPAREKTYAHCDGSSSTK
jgi:hypothetical protein